MVAVGVCIALVVTACSGGDDGGLDDATPASPSQPSGPAASIVAPGSTAQLLSLRLSEGSAFAGAAASPPVVEGTPLSDDEVAEVLGRLPSWEVPETDRQEFNRPPESLRPPLVGDTIEGTFPPSGDSGGPSAPAEGPLEVLRFQPEGDVAIAPFLSVTFSQPMVPVATLDQLASEAVPAVVTPAVDGRWRWIGTRTLRFEVEPGLTDRLPAATDYRVEIPAGTTSATGGELAAAVSITFATPPPVVQSFVGESDSLPLTPVFVATFDQVVTPAAVLDHVTLTADERELAVREATAPEIEADDDAARAVAAGLEGRVVAFRATELLPVDSPVAVSFDAGTPSAEGPLVTEDAQVFRAHTFGRLEVTNATCGYGEGCTPLTPFVIEFNNTIDATRFSPSMVTVDPTIPGSRVDLFGNTLQISGATAGRTTYQVTLAGELTDTFGQTLGEDYTKKFDVGAARPYLQGFDRQFVTVDPATTDPTVSVTTINHDSVRVTAWAVAPDQYQEYLRFLDTTYSDTEPPDPDWPRVLEREVDIDGADDTVTETAVDLSDAFAESGGPLVVRLEPTREFAPNGDDYWQNRPSYAFVQQTTLAVDAFIDSDELLIWTTDLVTGRVLRGVTVTVLGPDAVVTTDADGLARYSLAGGAVQGLVAELDGAVGILPSSWYDGWSSQSYGAETRWYVFDDRGVYKPGETARLTGWVRSIDLSGPARLESIGDAVEVEYRAYDPQGNDIDSGTVELNALGGFNLTVDVPETANLGPAYVELQLTGADAPDASYGSHSFQIQQFRTPEFEVSARPESPGPYYTADPATVAVDAAYFAGGPLPDAEVQWLVSTASTTYAPPGWDDFVFGVWQPWWFEGNLGGYDIAFGEAIGDCFDCGPGFGPTEYEQFSGRTDAAGSHYLQIDFEGPEADLPSTVTAEATVFDVNRQAWASRTDLLVHSARYYVGLRTDRPFVEQGTPIRVDVVATDVDGNPVAGRDVEVTAGRVESNYVNGTWTEEVVDPATCTVTTTEAVDASGELPRCEFATELGGTYRITALVTDDDGHPSRTEITQWVTGGERRPTRSVQQEQVTIVPDAETYATGDTARLFVEAPFAPATGLVTVAHGGIDSSFAFDAADGTAIVAVPIADGYVPNVTVQVDMVGSSERTADDGTPLPDGPGRVAFATGRIDLSVPPIARDARRGDHAGRSGTGARRRHVGDRRSARRRRRSGA